MIPIFVNPYSGSGANRQKVQSLASILKAKHNLDAQIVETRQDRRAQLASPDLPERCRCLVVAGGDGTIASVINECSDNLLARVPLAVMSAGNENLLARELRLFRASPEKLAAAIAQGSTRTFDLGTLTRADQTTHKFILMASAGLDSNVVQRVEAWRKLPQGLRRATRLSYLKPILTGLLNYHDQPIRLTVNGQTFTGSHIFIMNTNRYAGGLSFTPDACTDDGKLNYLVLTRPGRLAAIAYLLQIATGRRRQTRDMHTGCATTLHIDSDTPLPIQADGDTIAHTPTTLGVIPNAVRFIIPA